MKENAKATRELHMNNFRKFGVDINIGAVLTSMIIIIGFVGYAIINRATIYDSISGMRDAVMVAFNIPMIGIMLASFFLVLIIGLSPLGKIRVGGKEAEPEFKRFSWYSMLFGAGMGIGFMFWGVAEPLIHSDFTPLFNNGDSVTASLATSFFHWGLFPWAIYALISLALAFYAYNLNLPLAPRSMFYPILKDKIYGHIGDVIDGLAVVVTLFSLASSLGFGALQVNAGFNYLFGIAVSVPVQVIIIVIVTFFATLSLITGLDKGIRILSEMNIYLAVALVSIFFLVGPTGEIITQGFSALMSYIGGIIPVNFMLPEVGRETQASLGYDWTASWTVFYWAWWIGWTIFVGMFIAKISYGRTVRDFLLSVMIIPTIIAIVWFSVFGVTAIEANAASGGELLSIVSSDESLSLYALIAELNINSIIQLVLNVLSIVLIVSFFVTSSDSGSLVVDGLTSGGSPQEPLGQKIFWAGLEGALAIFLILIGGSAALDIIQMVLIIVAGPFSILLIAILALLVYQLVKSYTYYKKHNML